MSFGKERGERGRGVTHAKRAERELLLLSETDRRSYSRKGEKIRCRREDFILQNEDVGCHINRLRVPDIRACICMYNVSVLFQQGELLHILFT